MKDSALFLLIIYLFSMSFIACDKNDDEQVIPAEITTAAELTTALDAIHSNSAAAGFAVSIIKNDGIIYQSSFGKADLQADRDYTNQTTQPIASISKTFVAAAIVKAVEQGYFTLETDINDILPFELKNPKQTGNVIQVRHLVTHTSGLLDVDETYYMLYNILPGEDLSTPGAEILKDEIGFQQRGNIPLGDFLQAYYLDGGELYSVDNFASTAPGTAWSYSNIATALAAYLVEIATGTPFKEYVRANIFQPLGMNNTSYDVGSLNAANVATLYWDKNTSLPKYAKDSYPDSDVNTSNEDLAKYLQDMIKGARGESATLFSIESYQLLFEAAMLPGTPPAALGEDHSIFWFLGNGITWHDGGDLGTSTSMLFDEAANTGYILISNMDASTDAHEVEWLQMQARINAAITEFSINN